MKSDNIVLKRFEELEAKASALLENKEFDFRYEGVNHYKINSAGFKAWATNALNLLQRIFGENSIHYRNFKDHYQSAISTTLWVSSFEDCRAIFQAAQEDYEGGYLFNISTLAKVETLVDVLEQAEIFKDANYVDTACIMAGVALEIAVKEICIREGCAVGKFNSMNEDLRKKGIYNQAMWEQLKTWYTRRNEPAHGNFGQSTNKDADDMIKGIKSFIANYL